VIDLFKVFMSEESVKLTSETLISGYIGQGPKVEAFEKLLAKRFKTPYVNTVNSATSAIHLALHYLKGKHHQDEVLTTPLTCTATNWPILANGLKLRWVDVDVNTCNMDLDDLRKKLSPRTLAIMVVHWGGYPCDLDKLREIQDECEQRFGHRPPIIEDCAHAWGSTYRGDLIGSHGNTTIFSFQAIKHLTSGDGGLLVSPDMEHFRKARLLRWYGLDRESSADFRCAQNVSDWGFKFHMNDIAAAIALGNYEPSRLNVLLHKANGAYFNLHLQKIPGLTQLENDPIKDSAFWIYTIRVKDRPAFIRMMSDRGIAVSQVHARNDHHNCVKEFREYLPGMDVLAEDLICIPCGWWLTDEDRKHIVDSIRGGW
jgi:dTDP-4-amino-4,6-dideoxygalactose transaminase